MMSQSKLDPLSCIVVHWPVKGTKHPKACIFLKVKSTAENFLPYCKQGISNKILSYENN